MKQYLGLFVITISGLSGASVSTTLYPKPTLITSSSKQIKAQLNTPTAKTLQRALPYALLFVYYVHKTNAKDLLPGLNTIKTNVVGGTSDKVKIFTQESLNGSIKIPKIEKDIVISLEEKKIGDIYTEWFNNKENKGKSPADFAKYMESTYNIQIPMGEITKKSNAWGDKITGKWKKFSAITSFFKLGLAGYITVSISRDAKDIWNYVTTE